MVLFTKVYGELSSRIQQSLPRCNNRGAFQAHGERPNFKKRLACPARCKRRVSKI
jgi:hypothetical protein